MLKFEVIVDGHDKNTSSHYEAENTERELKYIC